ncbi:MAG: hypothetical protein WCR58_04495 [Bacteroidales bacterium]|jgi:hypothetical protein|nr:hypothetical protein [Bacteroidales bacterium]MDX9795634.1 hypothetical protein [Arcobacteraceae bacterium]
MNLNIQNTEKKGFIHYVESTQLIRSYKGKIFLSKDELRSEQLLIDLSQDLKSKIKLLLCLSRRLFRFYIYHVIPFKDQYLIFGLKKIFVVSGNPGKVIKDFPLSGSRPLIICADNDSVYYGEYFGNDQRRPVKVFKYSTLTNAIEELLLVENIRHIHGMFYDPYTKKIFLTTGDEDHESFIGYIANKNIVKLVTGSQQARVVQLLFDEKYIYYATDAPFETNHIYRYNRVTASIEQLQAISGTVFYGAITKHGIFFSTVVDTNKNLRQDSVELWFSESGDKWKNIKEFKKDIWPKKLFQYGQLIMSDKQFNSSAIWFTPFALLKDQQIHKIEFN